MSLLTNFTDLASSVKLALDRKADKSEIPVIPELATVATSGSYNDLSDKPTIPTAGTITSGETGYATGGDVYTALSEKEATTNKVTSLSSSSTDTQYPSAKCVYDAIQGAGGGKLPSGYQEVEWIGSSGTQRIETGFYNDIRRDIKFEGTMSFSDVTTRQLIGSQGGFYIGVVDGYIQAGLGGSNHSNIAVLANNFFDFSASYFAKTVGDSQAENVMVNVRSKDNTIHGNYAALSGHIGFSLSNYYQICLFALNGQNLPATCKMGEFRLYIYNYLVRDLIPCYRIADGVIGMFDLVAGDFLTNAGTGTFTKGADV